MKRLEEYDVFSMPVETVYYDRSFNCRGQFTMQSVKNLAESIEQNGLQFPVVVQPIDEMEGDRPSGYQFRLLAGHRRFTAVTTFLKWPNVPASLRHGLTDRQARMLNFTENLERKDLNILEEARAIGNLYPEGVSLRTAAEELKRPTRWVHIRLRLLKLPEEIQSKAAAGLLSATNIEAIVALDDPAEQLKAAEAICRVKQHSKTRSLSHLNPRYQRKFRTRRSKQQINEMIAKILDQGIEGLTPRALAWAAGYVTDEELEDDIRAEIKNLRRAFSV